MLFRSLQGGSCGFFTDVTGLPGVLPPASKGSQCVGTDCLGNAKLLTFKYDAANPDIFIARSSGDGQVRPHRLLKNNCGTFTDYTLAAWSPMPIDNDKISYPGALLGDVFGHKKAGDGDGSVMDLMILSVYGPRLYQNVP